MCHERLESVNKYQRHVGRHQEQLAIFALPSIQSQDDEHDLDDDESNPVKSDAGSEGIVTADDNAHLEETNIEDGKSKEHHQNEFPTSFQYNFDRHTYPSTGGEVASHEFGRNQQLYPQYDDHGQHTTYEVMYPYSIHWRGQYRSRYGSSAEQYVNDGGIGGHDINRLQPPYGLPIDQSSPLQPTYRESTDTLLDEELDRQALPRLFARDEGVLAGPSSGNAEYDRLSLTGSQYVQVSSSSDEEDADRRRRKRAHRRTEEERQEGRHQEGRHQEGRHQEEEGQRRIRLRIAIHNALTNGRPPVPIPSPPPLNAETLRKASTYEERMKKHIRTHPDEETHGSRSRRGSAESSSSVDGASDIAIGAVRRSHQNSVPYAATRAATAAENKNSGRTAAFGSQAPMPTRASQGRETGGKIYFEHAPYNPSLSVDSYNEPVSDGPEHALYDPSLSVDEY
jgi:hypothetical protein